MQLIDTHVHVNFDKFETDLEAVASRWRDANVVHLIHSCCHPEEFASLQAIADRFGELSFAVGLHPLEAHRWTEETAYQIRDLAMSDERVVAIGETGLDFYKADNQQRQISAFSSQMQIALELKLPIIVHCRDASSQMLELLRDFWKNHSPVPGVMHCWSGTPQEMQGFLDLGFYISFSGIVTFKNATQIQECARKVGSDRLLLETDCPFLAPVPKRGQRNEPAYVGYVAEQVASLRGVSVLELASQTTENACRLFGLSINRNGEEKKGLFEDKLSKDCLRFSGDESV